MITPQLLTRPVRFKGLAGNVYALKSKRRDGTPIGCLANIGKVVRLISEVGMMSVSVQEVGIIA
jgi:hypothetical protein